MTQQGADLLGRTLARTYHIERLLGGGGMGAVYAAKHVRTGGMFAVKVLHRETAADAEIYKRFQDEARTLSTLRHPHIVQVTDFDRDDDGTPFIVMEMLEGEDLYQRLCRVGKMSVEAVLDIARQVGSALHAAHEKSIIHRDIKPQNIFLVRQEVADVVTEVAKVVDFGISKIRRTGGGPQMTRDMTILGTPQFMSPEAALGQNSQLDGRADQWSLAVIMYLALSGRLPFDGENLVGVLYLVVHETPTPLKQLAPEVPDFLINAIERALSKKKDDRFPRMVDFVRALSGTQSTAASSVRLGAMSSAVFAIPPVVPGPAMAPVAIQQPSGPLAPQQNPVPSPQAAIAASNRAADAPTAVPPHLFGAAPKQDPDDPTKSLIPGEIPTRPAITALDPNALPLTVPVLQTPPELVGTPTSPTAFPPYPSPAAGTRPATPLPPRGGSGNTPTNISMSESAIQALLTEGDTTPADGVDPEDLQGVATKVTTMPQFSDSAPPSNSVASGVHLTVPMYYPPANANTTIPLGSLRPPNPNSPIDTAYPSTLSRATGQELSLEPGSLTRTVDWRRMGRQVLELCGVEPRSMTRLYIVAGVALTFLVLMIALVVTSDGSESSSKRPDLTTTPPPKDSGERLGVSGLPDGGTGSTGDSGKKAIKPVPPPPTKKPSGKSPPSGKR